MAQDERSALIFALPLEPHYGGRIPVRGSKISGAQNLSGGPRVLPGHRALGLQKLQVQRFHSRACLCRANAPGAILAGAPRGSPTQTRNLFLKPVGEDDSPYQGADSPYQGEMAVGQKG